MKRQTNLLPWGALILTLALLDGWLLNVSEVAAEPPDPYVVNATDDRTSVTIQRYFYHLTYHGTIEIGSWQHWEQDS